MKKRYLLLGKNGFTLLEMIVAMTLAATLGVAIFAWISTTISSLHRVEENIRHEAALNNAVAFLETLNPMVHPQGEVELGSSRISWTSIPAAPVRRSQSILINTPGFYDVGLFSVRVDVFLEDVRIGQFTVQAVGYKDVRSPAR